MRRAVLVGLAVAALLASSAAAQERLVVRPSDLHFSIAVPAGVRIEKQAGPDFDVYYFQRGETTIAGAYDGFAPNFPGATRSDLRRARSVLQTVTCAKGRATGRELLFNHSQGQKIHVWTASERSEDLRDAERMLVSIGFADWPRPLAHQPLKTCG